MAYETIIVERIEKVGVIKLNRPQQRNALNAQLANEIVAGLNELENDFYVRVIVMMSAVPGVFSAGRDLAEVASLRDGDILKQRQLYNNLANIAVTIRAMRKMVITAVRGSALGGGSLLTIASDLAIVAEDAVFGFPQINIGIFGMLMIPLLTRLMNPRKCLELLSTGDRISAKDAETMGLVNKVVPPEKLEESAMELAKGLAKKSATGLQLGKQAFYIMADLEYTKAMKYAVEMITILANTHDAKEGADAFMEKRIPRWQE